MWERELPISTVPDGVEASDPLCVVEAGRLENAVMWRNSDGSLTARGYSSPVNFKDAVAGWRAIDTRLVSDADGGLVNRAGPFTVRFAESSRDSSLVEVEADGASIAFRPAGPRSQGSGQRNRDARPTVSGGEAADTVRYPGGYGGADLTYQVTATSVKESIVLPEPPADGSGSFPFEVALRDLAARSLEDGSIEFSHTDSDKSAFHMPHGVAWDSSGDPDSGVEPARTAARVELVPGLNPSAATLMISVDPAWLADPRRVYPVTVDPTLTYTNGGTVTADAYVSDAAATTTYNGAAQYDSGAGQYWDRAGTAGSTTYYSYQALPSFAFLRGQEVVSATWNGYAYSTGGGGSVSLTAKPASSAWSVGGATPVTWANQPTLRTNSASVNYTAGNQWKSISITSWVKNWAKDPGSNGWGEFGLRLSGPAAKYVNLAAEEAPPGKQPYVEVVYDAPPAMSDYTAGGTISAGTVNDATPTLAVTVSDSDSQVDVQPLTGQFQLWNSNHSVQLQSGTGSVARSGDQTQWTTSSIGDGTYKWRVRADDGVVTTAWSAWQTLVVDTVAPAAPLCGVWLYPTNSWVVNDIIFFSVAGAHHVLWGLDSGDVSTNVVQLAPNGSAVLTNVDISWGWHTLVCRAVDAAGNVSASTTYGFGFGDGGFVSPEPNFDTQKRVPIEVVTKPSYDGVRLQWRRAEASSWADVPPADVAYKATGASIGGWPVTATPGSAKSSFPSLVWNAAATTSNVDGPLQLRFRYYSAGAHQGDLPDDKSANINLDQQGLGAGPAAVPVGPGTVNLLTGNLQVVASDVALGSGVERAFDSRTPNTSGIFGPGWKSNIGGGPSDYRLLNEENDAVVVTATDGSLINFRKQVDGSFVGEAGFSALTLTRVSSTVFELRFLGYATFTFTHIAGAANGEYEPTSVDGPSGIGSSTVSWQVVGGKTRPVQVVQPTTNDVSCVSNPLTTRGCRVLSFDYAGSNQPVAACGTGLGDVAGNLRSVRYTAWDPELSTPAMRTIDVSRYCYALASSRLMSVWDPRVSPALKTQYTYNADGHLASVVPPGVNGWTFGYQGLSGEPAGTGRLATVSRVMPVGSTPTNQTATTSIVYEIPLTTGGGGPYDLNAATTATWSQADNPADATAIFPADQLPSGTPPSSYARATVYYMNIEGQMVNVAKPGGHIATTQHDAVGNPVRTLTPGNRARALSSGSTAGERAAAATTLDERTVYGIAGLVVTDTYGPAHFVALPDGSYRRVRRHVAFTYDEGAPSGLPHLLPTKRTVSASPLDGSSDQDVRTVTNAYSNGSDNSGWTLATPMAVTVDPGSAGHLNLTKSTTYNVSTGQLVSWRLPANPAGGDAGETEYIYYTAGVNGVLASCGNRPEWSGLACRKRPAAQPGTPGLPDVPTTHIARYDLYGNPLEATDSSGSSTRTMTRTYDAAGRLVGQSVISTLGAAVASTTIAYHSTTGLVGSTSDGTGTIARAYDASGQMSVYNDGSGATTTITYDLLGRPSSKHDGKRTTTFSYNNVAGELRGLLTTISDSQAGTFTAEYDADERVKLETFPGNNVWRFNGYNEVGAQTDLLYFDCLCSSNDWPYLSARYNVHGQKVSASQGIEAFKYSYDAAGRLTSTDETVLFGCSKRDYVLDANSNRTGLSLFSGSMFQGSCPPGGAPSSTTTTYDAADRAITSGYSYDGFGRTLTVPASDSPSGTTTTMTYHVNDMVRTISSGGATATFGLDPMHRVSTSTSTADGQTRTVHYSDDGDGASWIAESTSGAGWTRNVMGFSGLGAIVDESNAVRLQLSNLQGDIFSTTSPSETDWVAGLASGSTEWIGTDEYGTGGSARYGYRGSRLRASETQSGIQLMGVRLYNPSSGRFLQQDSISGASCTSYDYVCADPVNLSDPSGQNPEEDWCRGDWGTRLLLCLRAQGFADRAEDYTRAIFGRIGGQAEPNAFQHAVWLTMMTMAFGPGTAAGFGTRHEQTSGCFCMDSVMDYYNNNVGLLLGVSLKRNWGWPLSQNERNRAVWTVLSAMRTHMLRRLVNFGSGLQLWPTCFGSQRDFPQC